MPDYIKINGNTVQYVREEIVREAAIDSFIANIEANMGCDSGMLPRGCLYMKKAGDRCVYLVEIPAGIVPVSFKREGAVRNFQISIPFTQFYVVGNPSANTLNDIRVSVTKKPLVSVDQEIFIAPYLNLYDAGMGSVCTGSMVIPQNAPLNKKVDAVVSTFFEADFNADLQPRVPKGFKCAGRTNERNAYIPEWAEFTKADRFFAVSDAVKYDAREDTPKQIIDHLASGR